jgi:hypothetical protein
MRLKNKMANIRLNLQNKPKFFPVPESHIQLLGLTDPDPLVRGMDPDPALNPDPDPSIIMQKQ